MNKKGFTFVELLGVIVILVILSSVAVISINAVISNGKEGVYKNLEKTLKGATENYFIDNTSSLPNVNGNKTITYNTLLTNHYIDPFEDPNGGDCSSSYVIVSRGVDKGINFSLSYQSCVVCKDSSGSILYKTKDC